MRRPRQLVLAIALGAGALLLTACVDSAPRSNPTVVTTVAPAASTSTAYVPTVIVSNLPDAVPGQIVIDGEKGTLTPDEKTSYLNSGTSNQLVEKFHGSDAAYAELCAGTVDMVDSSQRITTTQVAACQANGLHVVQFEIAADAFVIAIKNETDVGGDCLTTTQVGDIYRAGSPMLSWNQLGGSYRAIGLHAAGPDPSTADFGLFSSKVFGSTTGSLLNFRSDYQTFHTDDLARQYVVGTKGKVQSSQRVAPMVNGRVSFFRYSYYTLYEEQLRPFEISQPGGARDCIFPSSETITNGQYPFSRQYMITTTTRALARGEVKDFLLHYLNNATALATASQFVPLSQPQIDGQKAWVSGTIAAPEIALPTKSASPTAAQTSPQPAS